MKLYYPKDVLVIKNKCQIKSYNTTLETTSVIIKEEDYILCRDSSTEMWCSEEKKDGEYNGKLGGNTKRDPRKIERISRLGECGFAGLFGLGMNVGYKKGGDEGFDFEINGLKIDIKTGLYNPPSGHGLFKAKTPEGKMLPLNSDYYVFAYLITEKQTYAAINYVGYIHKKEIPKYGLKKARNRGKWMNYEVPYVDLKPLKLLQNEIGRSISSYC